MKDEIKEILSLLKSSSWCNEAEQIEDYITNLQEEKENQAHTIKTLLEENERLNNIINELEKYIEKIRLEYCNELVNQHNCIDLFIENSNKLNHIVNIKLKLKELKEGDSND